MKSTIDHKSDMSAVARRPLFKRFILLVKSTLSYSLGTEVINCPTELIFS